MSNKLRKKRVLKPDGYEERFLMQGYRKAARLAENSFVEVFYSMQLITYSVLYMSAEDGGFDFSKRKLDNFSRILSKNNQQFDSGGLVWATEEEKIKKALGLDCLNEAAKFPYRAKMKMYGRKVKNRREHSIVLASVNEGIEIYLILAIHTLHQNYRFSKGRIWQWWEACKKVSDLYARGMTDRFIIDYLERECGLGIEYEEKQI